MERGVETDEKKCGEEEDGYAGARELHRMLEGQVAAEEGVRVRMGVGDLRGGVGLELVECIPGGRFWFC